MEVYKILNNIEIGDVIDENIYNKQKHLLIKIGTKLNENHIATLKKNHISGVFIAMEEREEIIISPLIRKEVRDKVISRLVFSNFDAINKNQFNDLIEMVIMYNATKSRNETNK